ncbi:sigma-70 family RNA polymerase sigma factor [Stieleria sp. ICT_E10.1]|uniref:sigma-70 family RNA polymerase sigma factor n=1 Tax=Stieleria sedimenti TaxID=2976331 RepID=UPI00218092EB|nr:sigma-70 family RNA polymerase sigma factor [Stieleria sedimenti]MCS7469619.1 sigma-70 family RNA polymerase sigma factor [Stieleria sedimenti]
MTTDLNSSQIERLLERANLGDGEARDKLFAAHRRYLRVLIDLRMDDAIRVRVDPSDVVQETQLVASRRLDDFLQRRPTSFRIWLRRKALERLVDLRRRHLHAEKRSVRREVTLSDRSSMALARGSMALARGMIPRSPSEIASDRETAQQVRIAVRRMKETDREVLLLRHVEELTNAEVANVMDVDSATASQRYGRALRRLRQELINQGISNE